MKIAKLFTLGLLLAIANQLYAQQDSTQILQSLEKELERLQVSTALLLPSQGIDYYPTWSPDGKKLGGNVMGTWYSINLDSLALVETTWRDDQKLGVINSQSSLAESPQAEAWFDSTKFSPRSLQSSDGTLIELTQEGFATVFKITEPSEEPRVIWKSGMENCHSLTLSPDDEKVAFICEMNGIFVFNLKE
ncbi:PD40 domain-containing protein [Gracilimonas tropica]|uniref:PD40 domain-containing protein n=1 Tax=Gracilimonas tropica TaxID=454600 RepID=UPI00036A6638|nr:PD40 domain-containing protein [Gracilimonas tropica]